MGVDLPWLPAIVLSKVATLGGWEQKGLYASLSF